MIQSCLANDLYIGTGKGGRALGDHASIIGELYDEFHIDVYSFSLFFTNNKQDAEDITQETFIKAFQNVDKLKDYSKRKSWILSITRNTAVDLIRKQKRIAILPQQWLQSQDVTQEANQQKRIIQKENWQELQAALSKLKPHYRSVVILRALQDLSVKETAEILNCKETKVRVDLSRAIQQLRNELHVLEGWQYDEQTR